uniref:CUB domain-containing protein n=1 Tax=Heterorhabditis bacteriophora TaxID=37862 RepID=A0A1I7XQY3_HETBA
MHYGPYGFASDPYTPTIRTLERTQQSTIGQRAGPSFLDYQAARQEIQYISSPNYPDNFPLNTECYWMIQAAPGGRAFLEFVGDFDFLCEDTCDKSYVEVKYHNDKRLTGARISTLTVAPTFEIFATTQTPDVINLGIECGCNEWAEWVGVCSQQCGGCGHRRRTRVCQKDSCRKEEKRPCNFNVCPTGTNFLINNGEFHILWRGCCVGLFSSVSVNWRSANCPSWLSERTPIALAPPFHQCHLTKLAWAMCHTDSVVSFLFFFLLQVLYCIGDNELVISVKTTGKFHKTRVAQILETWYKDAKDETYFFTDMQDNGLNEKVRGHLITTNCSAGHTRWSCHFDDDNYVNIPTLYRLLSSLDPMKEWYLGKSSTGKPMSVVDNGKKVEFWFGTGGAGLCISRKLLSRLSPLIKNGTFERIGNKIMLPDDVTLGYIIERNLNVPLTNISQFHSHLEQLSMLNPRKLRSQITLSGSSWWRSGKAVENLVHIPAKDSTDLLRFQALYDLLHSNT